MLETLRHLETPRKLWSIGLVLAALGVVAATVCFRTSAASSGHATHAVVSSSSDYGSGRLMAADPAGGYWTVSGLGVVTSHGGAPVFGSPAQSGVRLAQPIVGMAATPDGKGYWLVGSDGGIFAFGDARFYGSTGTINLSQPIVTMAATPDGKGYWLVGSDGGIFAFGDARFYGSTGTINLSQPIVTMAATPDGKGYWLVGSDGGIFAFGDARFYGSTGTINLSQPIVTMAATPDGKGYWLVGSDGGIFAFGDARFYGSLGGSHKTVLGIIVNPMSAGYTLIQSDGSAVSLSAPSASGNGAPTSRRAIATTTTNTNQNQYQDQNQYRSEDPTIADLGSFNGAGNTHRDEHPRRWHAWNGLWWRRNQHMEYDVCSAARGIRSSQGGRSAVDSLDCAHDRRGECVGPIQLVHSARTTGRGGQRIESQRTLDGLSHVGSHRGRVTVAGQLWRFRQGRGNRVCAPRDLNFRDLERGKRYAIVGRGI